VEAAGIELKSEKSKKSKRVAPEVALAMRGGLERLEDVGRAASRPKPVAKVT
jgi:hypothetical protein